jgi:hypothetical protein
MARVYGARLDVVTRLGELELFAGVSGRSRLSPAICGEYARKLSGDRYCRWSQACRRWSVNPSQELRSFESCRAAMPTSLTWCSTSQRPPATPRCVRPKRHSAIHLLEGEGRCQLLGVIHSDPPGHPRASNPVQTQRTVHGGRVIIVGAGSLGSVVAEQLARNGVPTIDIVDPDVVEAVHLTRSSATTSTRQGSRPFHGICASGVRPTTRCA